jgi:hypothetical protein
VGLRHTAVRPMSATGGEAACRWRLPLGGDRGCGDDRVGSSPEYRAGEHRDRPGLPSEPPTGGTALLSGGHGCNRHAKRGAPLRGKSIRIQRKRRFGCVATMTSS